MTGAAAVLAPLAVVGNGVAAGIMLSTVIGVAPFFLALPYERYVQAVQFMQPRFDPIMPLTNGGVLVLDAVLAFTSDSGTARATYAVAAVLLAAVIAISVTRNVPVNKYVLALDPRHTPEDWERTDPRRRWRLWNAIRTSLCLAAFAVNVATAVSLA
ncbi:anthrone oxygenase family protein [Streptomyces sp. NPDC001262]|uniref:anthrone oxygenase family protein n=1 Tax=Streptomyces sp. NPDC001262 TaxID=3364552 RepID=UPI0036BF556D